MTGPTKTWLALFPVHPAADVFPMMPGDELGKLAEDIKANGLRHPIVLWQDNADTHMRSRAPYYVLDGRNRLAAMDLAGIPVPADPLGASIELRFALVCGWKWAATGRAKGKWEKTPGVDPAAFVIGANVRRRHLTKEQQADLILRTVEAAGEFSATSVEKVELTPPKPGRPKDPILQKAVEEAAKQGISKRTVEAARARQNGKARGGRASTVTPVPTIEPLNSAKAQTLLRQAGSELYRLVERGQKVQRLVDELGASPGLITELIDRAAERENAKTAKPTTLQPWEPRPARIDGGRA